LIKKSKPKIAIIGAGLAGLNLAKLLGEFADVIVFEKSDNDFLLDNNHPKNTC
jgi:renalase